MCAKIPVLKTRFTQIVGEPDDFLKLRKLMKNNTTKSVKATKKMSYILGAIAAAISSY